MGTQQTFGKAIGLIAVAGLGAGSALADATCITYDLAWVPFTSGGVATHNGTAFGQVTIDTALAPVPFSGVIPIGSEFTDFTVTISGTAGGDGTFTSEVGELVDVIWEVGAGIDFNSDLVPQSDFFDLNFFGNGSPGVPTGVAPNTFVASSGEVFVLSSAVPVPAPAASALLGLGGLAAMRRRR